MEPSQPNFIGSANIYKGIKDARRPGRQSRLRATRNDLLLQVGWKVQDFSGKDICDHESSRID